jgi:CubicO group peptidase (beta-lactamase class C family)
MKKVFRIIGLILLAVITYYAIDTYPKLDLISGFSAKSVASAHFIDNRTLGIIEAGDNDIEKINWAKNKINDGGKFSTASIFGIKERKAIYREGLGATLINDAFDVSKPYVIPTRKIVDNKLPFPFGNIEPDKFLFDNVDYQKLHTAVENAFDKNGAIEKRTRSLLVIYKDKIIAEKYDSGFNKHSKILGWSMTKSITATLFGILQKQQKFDINKPLNIAEWQNDDRKNITTNDLLHMNSGLEWEEDYTKISDVTKMLFLDADMSIPQKLKPAIHKPNTHWNYASGTTNFLSGLLRKQFTTQQEYLDFWYAELIDKIGMHSMLVETDMAGNFVGSSYGWANTRDWAKFGLLYLHKGNWNGEQIFDSTWSTYVATPSAGSNGIYGAHFWLNAGGIYPDVPKDLYSANGFQGQMVFIIPSLDIVIVRMGLKEQKDGFDFNKMLKEIIGSIDKTKK